MCMYRSMSYSSLTLSNPSLQRAIHRRMLTRMYRVLNCHYTSSISDIPQAEPLGLRGLRVSSSAPTAVLSLCVHVHTCQQRKHHTHIPKSKAAFERANHQIVCITTPRHTPAHGSSKTSVGTTTGYLYIHMYVCGKGWWYTR